MIASIHIQRLRNSEFLQFLTDFLAIVQLNNPAALQVQDQYTGLLSIKNEMEALFKKEQHVAATDELAALDDERDLIFNSFSMVVAGSVNHPDDALKPHARALHLNIISYGAGISRENYQSETAIINNLLTDWQTKPELAAAITALNFTVWQTALAAANSAFQARYVNRTQQIGATTTDTIKEKRIAANSIYYELRDHLGWYHGINKGAAPFGKTLSELNALIKQYSSLVSTRKKAVSKEF